MSVVSTVISSVAWTLLFFVPVAPIFLVRRTYITQLAFTLLLVGPFKRTRNRNGRFKPGKESDGQAQRQIHIEK